MSCRFTISGAFALLRVSLFAKCRVNEPETRQFGTKTVRHPLKKTVRHQDISAPVEKEAIINLIKIKSSDQMFTACVCIGDCLFSR
jgi:hypothetical protein